MPQPKRCLAITFDERHALLANANGLVLTLSLLATGGVLILLLGGDLLSTVGLRHPMNSSPLRVSVIIPAHNAKAHLAAAVSSVLGQTWAALEVIIVNDGSTDATLSIATRSSG